MPINISRRLRRKDASAYLASSWGISYTPHTLAKLAVIGGGPKFQYCGRFPMYPVEELDAWASQRLGPIVASTSEGLAFKEVSYE